jgi:cobyrinic acid a,c-diamide synthase
MGIISALQKKGYTIQPFKTGPDYIDPSYHTQISHRPCHNLDSWLLSTPVIREIFSRHAQEVDLAIIEGVMGLFDGINGINEEGSTAHLAKILATPVILIIESKSISRSAAAIAYGYARLDPCINLAGIIVNKIASASHYQMVKEAIERLAGIPVLGYLAQEEAFALPERHLGLIPTKERGLLSSFIERLSHSIQSTIDLDKVLTIAQAAPPIPASPPILYPDKPSKTKVKLALAWDRVFSFYYPENIELLEHYGAEIAYFSPLTDSGLPSDIVGIYIGGGFPELFAPQLEKNYQLRKKLKEAVSSQIPVYAECGGLMYLMEEIIDLSGNSYRMVGVIPGKAVMQKKRIALGYVEVEVLEDNILSRKGAHFRGHEFHWSALEDTDPSFPFCYQISKNLNPGAKKDGFILPNLLASYTHLHFASYPELAKNFVSAMIQYRSRS